MIVERAESPILRERAQILRDIAAAPKLPDEEVDPLEQNPLFRDLPWLIKKNRYGEISFHLSLVASRVNTMDLEALSLLEKEATLRDLTIITAAAVGFLKPVTNVGIFPGVESAVFRLADPLNCLPRNWDEPYTKARRRFTEVETEIETENEDGQKVIATVFAEDIFKGSVRAALSNQDRTIQMLRKATEVPLIDPMFSEIFDEIPENLARFVAAMTVAKKDLPPGYFCNLAKNFNQQRIRRPHEIVGRVYVHSGSQMTLPLFLDNALGIVTAQDRANGTEYSNYLDENLASATIQHRIDFKNMLADLQGKPIIHRLMATLAEDRIKGKDRQTLLASANSILAVLTSIYQARMAHLSAMIAQEKSAQVNNNGEVRISTGGHRNIPNDLLHQTQYKRNVVKDALDRLKYYPSLQ